jgi:hypothetical protein
LELLVTLAILEKLDDFLRFGRGSQKLCQSIQAANAHEREFGSRIPQSLSERKSYFSVQALVSERQHKV